MAEPESPSEVIEARLAGLGAEQERLTLEIEHYQALESILRETPPLIKKLRESSWPEIADIFEEAFGKVTALLEEKPLQVKPATPVKRKGGGRRKKEVASNEEETTKID